MPAERNPIVVGQSAIEPPAFPDSHRGLFVATLIFLLLAGIYLRLPTGLFAGERAPLRSISGLRAEPAFTGVGFDEALYSRYVNNLIDYGIGSYPDLVEHYVEVQSRLPGAILPPTRFVYIFAGYLWHEIFGTDALQSLHDVSSIFSVLLLGLSALFAWRLGGVTIALGVIALMAVAPTQIHMSQHALIDGVFAFWATLSLWLLWENLRRPDNLFRLGAYTASLTLLVLTKENAIFAYFGVLVLLASNRWLRFGLVTRPLLGLTLIGPLAGVVVLVFLCGGVNTFYATYRLFVDKASVLDYALATMDGPWHRYLVDLLLVSPLVLLLAWGAVFRLRLEDKSALYLALFVAATYVVMCNIPYGLNLRLANMWDMPLRYLALVGLREVTRPASARKNLLVVLAVLVLCIVDLRQYFQNHLYELVTGGLLRALRILK